ETGAKVKVFINGRPVWLTEHPSYKEGDFNESLLINERYLTTRVKKSLLISHRFSEFRFSSEEVVAHISRAGYDLLELEMDLPGNGTSVELYAFKNRQFIILHGEAAGTGKVSVRDFSKLGMGIWRLFVQLDEKLHPLRADGSEVGSFASLRHQIR